MANNRTAIRSALKAMLIGNTSAGSNVYSHRETSLWELELPAILIYTSQETTVPESLRNTRYYRTLELNIEVRVTNSTNVDSDIDLLVATVEGIVIANPSISGTVLSTIQTNTEIRINSDGQKDIGVGILTFECKYIS